MISLLSFGSRAFTVILINQEILHEDIEIEPEFICSAKTYQKKYKANQTPNPKPTHYPYRIKKKKKKKRGLLSWSNEDSILTPKIQMRQSLSDFIEPKPRPRTRPAGVV